MAKLFGDWRVWLFAVFAGYMYFVEIAPNWTTFRYKMTVEIQTPEGMKTGSSVVEYVRRPDLNLPGIAMMLVGFSTRQGTLLRAQHWTRGLATIIDVGSQGWVAVPRIWAVYDLYKIRPGELHSGLPKITLRYSDGAAAIWIPANGSLKDGRYGVARQINNLLDGGGITKLTIEPTSDAILTRVPTGAPAWIDELRARTFVMLTDGGKVRQDLPVSEIEKGWW